MFFKWFMLIFFGLFTFNFFIKVFFKNEKVSILSPLISSSYLLILFIQLIYIGDKFIQYTIIPGYLVFHLIICLFFSIIIFYGILISKIILNETSGAIKPFKFLLTMDADVKIHEILYKLTNKVNKAFNPLYGVNLSEFDQSKMIKSFFYLVI